MWWGLLDLFLVIMNVQMKKLCKLAREGRITNWYSKVAKKNIQAYSNFDQLLFQLCIMKATNLHCFLKIIDHHFIPPWTHQKLVDWYFNRRSSFCSNPVLTQGVVRVVWKESGVNLSLFHSTLVGHFGDYLKYCLH